MRHNVRVFLVRDCFWREPIRERQNQTIDWDLCVTGEAPRFEGRLALGKNTVYFKELLYEKPTLKTRIMAFFKNFVVLSFWSYQEMRVVAIWCHDLDHHCHTSCIYSDQAKRFCNATGIDNAATFTMRLSQQVISHQSLRQKTNDNVPVLPHLQLCTSKCSLNRICLSVGFLLVLAQLTHNVCRTCLKGFH